MALKDNLLFLLENNREVYLSGEFIAEKLNVTRAAVWKGIKTLRANGFNIDAITNKGYILGSHNDIINSSAIMKRLINSDDFKIEVFDSIMSTNISMQERINEKEGLVIAANTQQKGMGRSGRAFYSPKDTGVYFSILLKPEMISTEAVFVTTMAAVAVCKAIESVIGVSPSIKWVNDIYLNDRKICGILTQGTFSLENNKAEYIILGIGINVYMPHDGFPAEIENIAGVISENQRGDLKNKLIAEILNEFWSMYKKIDFKQIVYEYRKYSFIIGKDIIVFSAQNSRKAKAVDIDDNCRLVVEFENGDIHKLSSGEIKILNIERQ